MKTLSMKIKNQNLNSQIQSTYMQSRKHSFLNPHKLLSSWLWLIAGLSLIWSCNSDEIYAERQNISGDFWPYGQSIDFDFEVKDTVPLYDLRLNVTYDQSNYHFENLYCKVKTSFPDGTLIEDLISFEMQTPSALENTVCRGNSCTLPIFLQENIAFNQVGKYKLSFEQFGRVDSLGGVEALALSVVRK